jgi:hypothetical protein
LAWNRKFRVAYALLELERELGGIEIDGKRDLSETAFTVRALLSDALSPGWPELVGRSWLAGGGWPELRIPNTEMRKVFTRLANAGTEVFSEVAG